MADAPASKAYKWLSALLCYPEQELLDEGQDVKKIIVTKTGLIVA